MKFIIIQRADYECVSVGKSKTAYFTRAIPAIIQIKDSENYLDYYNPNKRFTSKLPENLDDVNRINLAIDEENKK